MVKEELPSYLGPLQYQLASPVGLTLRSSGSGGGAPASGPSPVSPSRAVRPRNTGHPGNPNPGLCGGKGKARKT